MVIICKICQRIVPKVDAKELCDQCGSYEKSSVLPNYYNLWEVDEACKRCSYPMHVGQGQEQRFCPNCTAEAVNVKRGRELLERNLRERTAETKPNPFAGRIDGVPL